MLEACSGLRRHSLRLDSAAQQNEDHQWPWWTVLMLGYEVNGKRFKKEQKKENGDET